MAYDGNSAAPGFLRRWAAFWPMAAASKLGIDRSSRGRSPSRLAQPAFLAILLIVAALAITGALPHLLHGECGHVGSCAHPRQSGIAPPFHIARCRKNIF